MIRAVPLTIAACAALSAAALASSVASARQAPAAAALPTPVAGTTAAQVAAGAALYAGSTCAFCHGADGAGGPIGPSLVSGPWLWGGSLEAITNVISQGVPAPKQARSPMPARGGRNLSDEDVAALAAYVAAIGKAKTAS